MQLYAGMDVGTAKLPVAERRGIPHHLLDVLEVTESASVAVFQQRAREVIATLRERGATPVLVGGSALYTRAVLDRFDFPGTDEEVRGRWQAELDRVGAPALHAVLAGRDPEAAAGILPDNGRRVVRALEVIELTGEPYSASLPLLEYVDPRTVQIGVDVDRAELDRRIEARVDAMFDAGLVDEVRRLLDAGLADGRTAPGRSATARWRRTSPARRARTRRGRRPRRPPGGSPGARTRGSAATRGWSGCGGTTRCASRWRWPPCVPV